MISTALARALRDSGLVWHPVSGDAFRIDRVEVEGDVFTVSDMTVEAHQFPTGIVLGFNGTTEWALDSVDLADAVWLPREHQLRELLQSTFRTLARREDDAGFVVTAVIEGAERTFHGTDAADAYARALLSLIDLSLASPVTDEDPGVPWAP